MHNGIKRERYKERIEKENKQRLIERTRKISRMITFSSKVYLFILYIIVVPHVLA